MLTSESGVAVPPAESPEWLKLVARKAAGLRYGVIQVVVHEARVVQIELTEKVRVADSRERDLPSTH